MPMSYLIEDPSRDESQRGDPLAVTTDCGVTYWIAYCKVTRMPDAPRLKVRLRPAGAPRIEEFHP
ncbi:hypothetical protein MINTM008_19740 [Mycobacterium intracellulare]|uniref:Uncharacterized protein n=1 Tax=Mycobacterium paraintracellulare TaxID=1138383 RepID=A0ABM7KAH5_9MYCO|nr:hypothetical protein CKJ67_08390 [Mycobacterium intracellulare]OSC29051.1 hypothetical protein B8W68_05785 [Mycobacterium paraintracellulare]BCP36310.1 hypothetical protein MINTMi198_16800 [Mycobacterium intracellulare M.i.198]OBG14604.1 hypothetical protein A5769_18115 [Mycobacterium intracellulare]PBA21648.1 hypothetical protein CKJ68_08450 [Mycobacterium intracellulare]